MIDFTLSHAQQEVRSNAANFAAAYLAPARASYEKLPPEQRFQSTRPIVEKAATLGLLRSQIPPHLGGTGGSLIDVCLVVEEMYAVEPSVSLTLLSNALGLAALIAGGTKEQQEELLKPFLSGQGAPLAALVYSEPGGSANFFEEGGRGMATTARIEGDDWVVNGEKIWATNCAGWDGRGADLQCVVCRDVSQDRQSLSESAMILLITRQMVDSQLPGTYTVLGQPPTPGHTATSGPHIRFTNFYVPKSHLLAAPGSGTAFKLIGGAFTMTAALVGAMAVGIMRKTFDSALDFAKAKECGGTVKLLERQSVADVLIDIKMRTEAARYLTWKAAQSVELGSGYGELAFEAKIWCSEAAVRSVTDAMRAVGISSYSKEYPFAELMSDAMVLPIFDGGNLGVRRRQLQKVFLQDDYKPWNAAFG